MPTFYFSNQPTVSANTGFSDTSPRNSMTIPLGRASYLHATGGSNNPIWVTDAKVRLAGNGSSRTCSIVVGTAQTANFTVPSGTQAADVGFKSISYKYSSTTAATINVGYNTNGSVFLGRWGSTAPGTNSVWGQCEYVTVPSAPTSVSAASLTSGEVTVSWSSPSTNGDSAIQGYIIHLSSSSSFSSVTTNTVGSGTFSSTFTGLTVGQTYYARVFAYNAIYSEFSNSPSSIASATASATVIAPPTPAPAWNNTTLNPSSVTIGGSFSAAATANNTSSYSRVSGDSWLQLASTSTGGVTGTAPTTSGTYSITLRATGPTGLTTDQTYSVTVNGITPVWETGATLSDATDGVAYSATVVASASPASVSYSRVNRSATWVDVSSTGTISGTPTGAGTTTTITVRATSNGLTADRTFSIAVKSAVPKPTWITGALDLPNGKGGVPYSASVSANNATSYSITNRPSWMTFISSTGSISGTPPTNITQTTQYTFSITPTGPGGTGDARTFFITVAPPAPVWVKNKLTTTLGILNVAYSDSFTANFVRSDGYLITGLPLGLTYNQNTGVISGESTQVGTFNISVTVFGLDNTTIQTTDRLDIYYPGRRVTSVSPTQSSRLVNASRFNGSTWVKLTFLRKKTGVDGSGNDIWEDLSN